MNTLQVLMNGVFGRKVPAEFAAENYDYEAALHDEIKKLVCDENGRFSRKMWRRNKDDIFDLLGENLDEVLPQRLTDALNMFCEVRRLPQGSRPEFYITKGKMRGKQFVTRATESGNYEQFRLDRDKFDIWPFAIAGAGGVDFERYLDGTESITDIYEVINEGFIDRVFELIQGCLLESWNLAGRPERNKVVVTTFDAVAMRNLCNTIRPYGNPIIYCTPEFASEMLNVVTYDTKIKIAEQDVNDIRQRGYIGLFYGTPIVVMPQSFTDETNTKTVMNPSFAYVIPAGKEKLIKLMYEGNSYFREWNDHEGDNSIGIQGYTKLNVCMVGTPNYWGIYYNAGIDASGWEEYNKALVPTD